MSLFPSLTKCSGRCAPNCRARSITLRPKRQKTPRPPPQQRGLPSVRYAPGRFASTGRPVPASRPAATPAPSKAPPQPLTDRTLDAAHPVSGAGVAQSRRGQTDGDVTVFLENRWWRISWPSSVMPPAIRRHCPQRNLEMNNRLLNMLERRNGHANANGASEPA